MGVTFKEKKRMCFMGINYPEYLYASLSSAYQVDNLQEVWNFPGSEQDRIEKYHRLIGESDFLFNYHTGLFFWSKVASAKKKKNFVITYWDGSDADRALNGLNGFIGSDIVDLHLAASVEIKQKLEMMGIISFVVPMALFESGEGIKRLHELIMHRKRRTMGVLGSFQYKGLVPVFREYGYQVIDLQEIWDSELPEHEKEAIYRSECVKCDFIYNLYSGNEFWARISWAKRMGIKIITHWIGTDALDAMSGRVGCFWHSYIDYNFTCYELITAELDTLGIKTSVLPVIPFDVELKLAKCPSEHAVLIYLPEDRLEHYGYKESCELFKALPNLKFHIVANANEELFKEYLNVTVHGTISREEMNELWNQVSVYVRWIKHDGLSMSVIEALAKGRKVIWNFPYDGVIYVESVEQMISELKNVVSTPPALDIETSEKVVKELSKERFMEAFNKVIDNVVYLNKNW